MQGGKETSAITTSAVAMARMSVPFLLHNGTLYHMVHHQSQGWPGHLPIRFITPHCLPLRSYSLAMSPMQPPSLAAAPRAQAPPDQWQGIASGLALAP